MLFIRLRSISMPSDAEESGARGCGRRVSLKRRTNVACVASRKMSAGFSPFIARSFRYAFANSARKFFSLMSTTIATRAMPSRRTRAASVGMSVVGMLSTQK